MEDKGVGIKVVHFKENIGRSHNAEGIGMELVDWYMERMDQFSIKRRNRKLKITFELVTRESIIPIRGLVKSVRSARNDDRISGIYGPRIRSSSTKPRRRVLTIVVNHDALAASCPLDVFGLEIFWKWQEAYLCPSPEQCEIP